MDYCFSFTWFIFNLKVILFNLLQQHNNNYKHNYNSKMFFEKIVFFFQIIKENLNVTLNFFPIIVITFI